jgi:hypothetical protein
MTTARPSLGGGVHLNRGLDIRCRHARALVLQTVGRKEEANDQMVDVMFDAVAMGRRDAECGVDFPPQQFIGSELEQHWLHGMLMFEARQLGRYWQA